MAEDILKQYEDQVFSYTDAVSFAVMKQFNIDQAKSMIQEIADSRRRTKVLRHFERLLAQNK